MRDVPPCERVRSARVLAEHGRAVAKHRGRTRPTRIYGTQRSALDALRTTRSSIRTDGSSSFETTMATTPQRSIPRDWDRVADALVRDGALVIVGGWAGVPSSYSG